ncbi:MAG TPA: protein kinase [Anaerolineales bacterium]|nr:protein kinase [Anaerolineales bacterium]
MSTWIGKTLGKVYIDSLLARGGMAVVYLGMHTTLQRKVVVKILRNDFEEDSAALERFEREAQVVARLRHQNIVQVFDFDTVDDQPYIVMEYINGPSLSTYLNTLHRKIGRLELPQVSQILTRVASSLQYAHDSGVIHRDVKPANILLTSRSSQIIPGEPLPLDFEPVLGDFGLVRFLSSSLQTSTGKIVGTPAYMSTEQARGEHTDERTDIYSLGIVLYEMLAGHVPFDGETTMSILLKHINEPPPPIPGLAFGFQYVLDRALSKKAEERFQTPNELAAAFNEVLEETSGASTILHMTPKRTPSTGKADDESPLRRKWLSAALATILIGTMGALFFLNGRALPSPESPTPSVSSTIEINTPVTLISSPVRRGPTGLLRFQDGSAILDRATLTAMAMPAPPEGSQYEVWLVGAEGERLTLGILMLDENGKGMLTFDESQGMNLLAVYDRVEIIVGPGPDSGPDAIERVAYFYDLPEIGVEYVRQLLVSFALAPDQAALIQGMTADTKLIEQVATEMLEAFENGSETGTQKNAEAIMNILVGSQSSEHKDWNGDGQTTDAGSGYGFMLNVDNLGYIQAVYSHADYAANSPGVSQNMITNGDDVKACAQNFAQWVPELRDRILTILKADSLSEMDAPIRDAVTLADKMLNGIDANQNGNIEAVTGECGALTTYESAYRMADMPLLPVNLIATPTPTPTFSIFAVPTKTSQRRPDATSPNITVPNTSPPNTPVPPPADTPSGPRACNDGIDNDGDGHTDFPADTDCRNSGDNSE